MLSIEKGVIVDIVFFFYFKKDVMVIINECICGVVILGYIDM